MSEHDILENLISITRKRNALDLSPSTRPIYFSWYEKPIVRPNTMKDLPIIQKIMDFARAKGVPDEDWLPGTGLYLRLCYVQSALRLKHIMESMNMKYERNLQCAMRLTEENIHAIVKLAKLLDYPNPDAIYQEILIVPTLSMEAA